MARPGLLAHRKFAHLARLLRSEGLAMGHLEILWHGCYNAGDAVLGTSDDVEHLAHWKGKRGRLTAALLESGFIELTDERYCVHDLYDHAPDYVRRRMEREEERRKRGATISQARAEAGRKGGFARAGKTVAKRFARKVKTESAPNANTDKGVASVANDQQMTVSNGPAGWQTAPLPTPLTPHPSPAPNTQHPTPAPNTQVIPLQPPAARPRDELFDAVCEVGAADPKVNGSLIGKVCKELRSADPPYTPAEVRSLPGVLKVHGLDFTLTVPSIVNHIGRVRAQPPPKNGRVMTAADRAKEIASIFPTGEHGDSH